MNGSHEALVDFEAAEAAAADGEALRLDLDGYEGPMHLLLALARSQKVDLLKLSIAELADQYIAFVRSARGRNFAVAADYLVMAAWLAFLKSRLLLPKPERKTAEPAPVEIAEALAFRLAKLDAMRRAAAALKALPQVGREVFPRGAPEPLARPSRRRCDNDLYRLVKAYASQRSRQATKRYQPAQRVEAYPLDAARDRLASLLPRLRAWTPLADLAPTAAAEEGPSSASFLASTLSAGLELVREGRLEARQLEAFADVYIRRRVETEQPVERAA